MQIEEFAEKTNVVIDEIVATVMGGYDGGAVKSRAPFLRYASTAHRNDRLDLRMLVGPRSCNRDNSIAGRATKHHDASRQSL
jgi:hypothetical protein